MAERKQVDDRCMAVDRRGRPAALTPEHIVLLRGSVSRMPHATLQELAAELVHLGGARVCTATIRRTLRASDAGAHGKHRCAKRYGYTKAHRCQSGLHYSTDLTDAEWALVADLFERPAGSRSTLRAPAPC